MDNLVKKLAAAAAAGLLGISCGGNQASTDKNLNNTNLQEGKTQSGIVQPQNDEIQTALVCSGNDFQIVGGSHGIYAINSEGSVIWQMEVEKAVSALFLDGNGLLVAGFHNRIILLNSGDGSIIRELPVLGNEAFISSLSISDDGIFAADRNSSIVYRFSAKGRLLSIIGQNSPSGIQIPGWYFSVSSAGDGSVWISNPGHHRAEHYDLNGRYLGGFGTAGEEGFIGCCNPISLLALADGSVIAGEKGLLRVRQFSADGNILKWIAGDNKLKLNHLPAFLSLNNGKLNISDGKEQIIVPFPAKENT